MRPETSVRVETDRVSETLRHPDVHLQWDRGYSGPENDPFFDHVFGTVLAVVRPTPGAHFVDAGCGPGAHTIRLARRGFRVHAVDFSNAALDLASERIDAAGLADKVTFDREDLLQLSFGDGELPYVLCWGVLMHIPDVGRAVQELSRVLAPEGVLIVSEGNMHSLETRTLRALRRLTRRHDPNERKAAGLERWAETPKGSLLTRRADLSWLVRLFADHGVRLEHRLPGQFTELYVKTGHPLARRAIHKLNDFWFDRVRDPRLAAANVLIFRKRSQSASLAHS
jgi:2-polyprenyl-3-methyl-5-hydroxy-6-metoxy-1,4-benzoquinol methylase